MITKQRARTLSLRFLFGYFPFLCTFLFSVQVSFAQKQIAITMDDPTIHHKELPWEDINKRILKTLDKHRIKAALFVCGMRIDSEAGKRLLKAWDSSGHLICNHTYSHTYFNSKKISAAQFIADFERADTLINTYTNYCKYFRFPYLKEGNTKEKVDSMRSVLKETGYKNGHVSIDASDWYIDGKIRDTLKVNPTANLAPYREYYIRHILDRANYYDSLSHKVLGKSVKHTLLIHHSLLNALFLEDIILALEQDGWDFIDAKSAFEDPVYSKAPDIVPCGESIVYQLAKENSELSEALRYPAEDGVYEAASLLDFIQQYNPRLHKKYVLKK